MGRRRYSNSAFAATTYDLFGQRISLTSTYGFEYQHSERTI